jgi:hypothetical protein
MLSALQEPPHALYPMLHDRPHVATEHVAIPFGMPVHAFAHEPQCIGSVSRSTHEPLHAVSPFVHDAAHVPFEQTRSSAQAKASPHPPQWSWLTALFVSHPSDAESLQSPRFCLHDPTTHAPPTHAATPFAIEHGAQAAASQP